MKTKKSLRIAFLAMVAVMLVAACAFAMTACGGTGDYETGYEEGYAKGLEDSAGEDTAAAKIKVIGFSTSGSYIPYQDFGGYGSDFSTTNFAELTLYDDNTYMLTQNYHLYSPSWTMMMTDTVAKSFGVYTIDSEDEFGVFVDLNKADRVIFLRQQNGVRSMQDTDDITTFSDTESPAKTAQENRDELLASYVAIDGVEIDYATFELKLDADDDIEEDLD